MLKKTLEVPPHGGTLAHGAREIHVLEGTDTKRAVSRPKVLVLAPRFPYPALSGGKVVLLHLARALRNYDVTLLSFCGSREEMEFEPSDGLFSEIHKVYLPKAQSVRNVLRALPTRTPLQLAYYRSDAYQRKLEDLLPQHDLVIAHLIRTGQYIEESASGVPRILLMSDAISLAYQRMAELSGAPPLWHYLYRAELRRLLSYEQNCPARFDCTWLHSDVDRRFLLLDRGEAQIIPIGVDLEEFPFNPAPSGNVVAFIGNMSFSLNLDACNTFIRKIFPRLRSEAGIRFRVIGACPPSVKKKLEAHEGVEITGTVSRIADAVEGVFCGVCPIRGGSGMQNKVLNYMALGLPCVTSAVGLGGIGATPQRDLLVYKHPHEAAGMILNLHADATLRSSMARAGREFIENTHDWEIIYRAIRSEVARLIAATRLRTKVS
jgi:glycosyltransferase involved in cell wall biosynthesis